MCSPRPTKTTGDEIFNKTNIFFEENDLNWNDCIDICTAGAEAMTGNTAEVVSRIENETSNFTFSHCILQTLAMKEIPLNIKLIMDEALIETYHIKSRPLQP